MPKKRKKACTSRLRVAVSLYGYSKRFCRTFIVFVYLKNVQLHCKFIILSVVKMLEVRYFFRESFKTLILRFKLITFWNEPIFLFLQHTTFITIAYSNTYIRTCKRILYCYTLACFRSRIAI